jgi:hypothetical protein
MFYRGTRIKFIVHSGLFENLSSAGTSGSDLFNEATPGELVDTILLCPILRKTLKRLKELPERNNQKQELLLQSCSDVFLDGVKRNIQRQIDR